LPTIYCSAQYPLDCQLRRAETLSRWRLCPVAVRRYRQPYRRFPSALESFRRTALENRRPALHQKSQKHDVARRFAKVIPLSIPSAHSSEVLANPIDAVITALILLPLMTQSRGRSLIFIHRWHRSARLIDRNSPSPTFCRRCSDDRFPDAVIPLLSQPTTHV
jgi:hypothetical protein